MNANNDDDKNGGGRLRDEIMSILQRQQEFPLRQRNKLGELMMELRTNLGNDIHEMLCERYDPNNPDEYRGLDSNRDTVAEVETAIRFFPEILSRGEPLLSYPIQCLTFSISNDDKYVCNFKAVSFIHILAQLAIEFDSFKDHERGGLVLADSRAIEHLVYSSDSIYGEEHNQHVDEAFLTEMVRLRRLDLFKKEDIKRYDLMSFLYDDWDYFAENRFRFLVEWDPTLLRRITFDIGLPLHGAALDPTGIQRFRIVFEYGIRYFPNMRGINLLFQIGGHGNKTPLQLACGKFKREKVMEAVEDTLNRCSDTTPLKIADALIVAATDRKVRFDGVYFLLRRKPDALITLSSNNDTSRNVGEVDISC